MTETLYPHEVVAKWFEKHQEIVIVLFIAILTFSVLVYVTEKIVTLITLNTTLVYNQSVPVQWSCASPLTSLMLIVFWISVICYGVRICAPSRGLKR